jgi:hypothetical protein
LAEFFSENILKIITSVPGQFDFTTFVIYDTYTNPVPGSNVDCQHDAGTDEAAAADEADDQDGVVGLRVLRPVRIAAVGVPSLKVSDFVLKRKAMKERQREIYK